MVLETILNASSMGFRQGKEKKLGRGIKMISLLLNDLKLCFEICTEQQKYV